MKITASCTTKDAVAQKKSYLKDQRKWWDKSMCKFIKP